MARKRRKNRDVMALAEEFARRDGLPPPKPLTPDEIDQIRAQILSDPEWVTKIEQGFADLDAGRRVKLN